MCELQELQTWYYSQRNRDWEHSFGIEISTVDNPGWRLKIDLADTELEKNEFEETKQNYEHEVDWLRCWREGTTFHAACGPLLLGNCIQIFLDWKDCPSTKL